MPDDREPRLPASFYRNGAKAVARRLLGQRLVSTAGGLRTSGIIVETEAYLGAADKAAHTYGGRRTERNRTMWADGGLAYVYFVYGMHHCVNVVAGRSDDPVAVLVRALQPDEGVEVMFGRRAQARRTTDLCSGPGKLCQALGITREHDGADLVHGTALFIERRRLRALASTGVGIGPRIGVGYAQEWRYAPLRFRVRGNAHVSRRSG